MSTIIPAGFKVFFKIMVFENMAINDIIKGTVNG